MSVNAGSSVTRSPSPDPVPTPTGEVSAAPVAKVTTEPPKAAPPSVVQSRTSGPALGALRELAVMAKQEKAVHATPSPSPLAEHITAPPKKRLSFTLVLKKGGELHLAVAEKRATEIPADAAPKLVAWRAHHKAALAAEPKRIVYDNKEIPDALQQFHDEYHCNWQELKNNCKDKKLQQIINDLRSAYLEENFAVLRREFPALKEIGDVGSKNLTSDCDFAFEVSSGKQATETQIVKRFNQLFEAQWGAPSSIVFDSNAYTNQYLLRANNPKFEEARSSMQQEGSLLMKLRNATPKDWALFKAATLAKLPLGTLRAAKQAEFAKVEKQNGELHVLLQKEIVRMGAILPGGGKVDVDSLPPEQLARAAAAIKEANPDIETRASNELHYRLKTGSKALESQRGALQISLETLDHASNLEHVDKFTTAFNARISRTISNLQAELAAEKDPVVKDHLRSNIDQLLLARIGAHDGEDVMIAYKERSGLQHEEQRLHHERADLEGQVNKLTDLMSRLKALEAKRGIPGSAKELTASSEEIDKIKAEISKVEVQFGAKADKDLPVKMGEKMNGLDAQLRVVKENAKEAARRHGESWDKAGALGMESDHLLVNMQRANLLGMCFAPEAHGSEGAFLTVVGIMQAGRADVGTPNQYIQAFREISGFCSGHQAHQATPHGKMVEASKYAGRLMLVSRMIDGRAAALGIPPPVTDVNRAQLDGFFKAVAPLRGTTLTDAEIQSAVQGAARASGLVAPTGVFNAETVDHINSQIEQLGASLETWISMLPEKDRNAYYRVV